MDRFIYGQQVLGDGLHCDGVEWGVRTYTPFGLKCNISIPMPSAWADGIGGSLL